MKPDWWRIGGYLLAILAVLLALRGLYREFYPPGPGP